MLIYLYFYFEDSTLDLLKNCYIHNVKILHGTFHIAKLNTYVFVHNSTHFLPISINTYY